MHTVPGAGAGQGTLGRRLAEIPAGSHAGGVAGPGGELCFVIAGRGWLETPNGPGAAFCEDTGLWLPPGVRYRLAAGGPGAVRLDMVSLPAGPGAGDRAGGAGDAAGPRLRTLGECAVEVTGDRGFRVLFGPGNGCGTATQFVGEIPPGRAPRHSHPYDELVLVLSGEGVLHAGAAGQPLAPGTSVHLPPGTPHCLENTGRTTLRVLGVFHPGGSPASKLPGASPSEAV